MTKPKFSTRAARLLWLSLPPEPPESELSNRLLAIEDEASRDLREALEAMVEQYAYRGKDANGTPIMYTMGMSALELAFEALGWDDPQPMPEEWR